jgi:hypothetical protein
MQDEKNQKRKSGGGACKGCQMMIENETRNEKTANVKKII